MNINQALGLIIKEKLKELNITKDSFAKRAGLSRAGLYVIIEGSSSPSLDTICMIAKELKMTPSSIIAKASKLAAS